MSNIQLSEDSLEDLIYFSRTGDLSSLQTLLSDLSTSHAVSKTTVLLNAIDADPADGTGSRNSLLHYPAANGNLEMIEYLLTTLGALSSSTSTGDATEAQTQNAEQPQLPKEVKAYISHPNLSSNTPLHWAALNGHMAVVKALVKAGADPTLVNAAGRDAVVEAEYSAKDGTDECATWLLGECGGLEKGVGGAGVGEGEAEDVEAEVEDNGEGSSSVGNRQVNGA